MWPRWRKSDTVEVGFEVIYDQAVFSVTHSLSLLPMDQDVELCPQYHVDLCVSTFPVMIMD